VSEREVYVRHGQAGPAIRVDAPPAKCPSCGASLIDYHGVKVCPTAGCRARVQRKG
jgi:hypothetical protein